MLLPPGRNPRCRDSVGWSKQRARVRSPALADDALSFVQESPQDEPDVGRTFAKPPHEVRKPLVAEWDVYTHPISLPDQRRLQVASNPEQHLELKSIRRDAALRRIFASRCQHGLVVGGDRRIDAVVQEEAHQAKERGVDFALL